MISYLTNQSSNRQTSQLANNAAPLSQLNETINGDQTSDKIHHQRTTDNLLLTDVSVLRDNQPQILLEMIDDVKRIAIGSRDSS